MSVLSLTQVLRSYFLFSTVGIAFISDEALATPCQVYPSEYAYHDDSVTRVESTSAKCRRYPLILGLPAGILSIDYLHCDGTRLKLADANLGSEQFSSSGYYQWSTGSDGQLLFIFPTRVSLTNITLHYYSDSVRGLPRLRFYVVPDDFDVWDAPATGTPYGGIASVPPGAQPAGRRNIRITSNFNTQKVLMYKFSSTFLFAVSEVEFFTMSCNTPATQAETTEHDITTSQQTSPITTTSAVIDLIVPPITTTEGSFKSTEDGSLSSKTLSSDKQSAIYPREITAWVLIVILVVLFIASVVINVILILALRAYRRSNKANDPSPDCVLAMDSNPCYEASDVKQTEAQEAVHVYETVKQHS